VTVVGDGVTAPGRAVVIGASIAGLLAASVLSEVYPEVIVYDRDTLPATPEARRGVPQGRHAHALHARGARALTELLPGFWDEMVAAGGVVGDTQGEAHWYLDDYKLKQAHSGLDGILLTRPAIEHLIRSRVAALPRVRIVEGTDVTRVLTSTEGKAGTDGKARTGGKAGRVTGVAARAARTRDAADETVAADLVVDAAGRASRTPVWLGELGFPVPTTSEVRAGVVYVCRLYRRDPAQLDGRFGTLIVGYPGNPRGGAALRQEGDRWIVLLAGMVGEEPPMDDAGLLAYADSLVSPDLAMIMRESEPLGEALKYRFPESVWRHYEKLDRYLDGLLVFGDAFSSFNPLYGQGMTIAALEALALRRLLGGRPGRDGDLTRRYFREAGRLVAEAWETSAAGDLRFPEVAGKRPPGSSLIYAYLARYRAAASVDPVLGRTFLQVANMIDKPTRLLSPSHVLRVFLSSRKAVRPCPDSGTRESRGTRDQAAQ
jgi:2-polyprenyl-6-methoxyphenol hydroxylase-like FAD-dependent oxidoreductase